MSKKYFIYVRKSTDDTAHQVRSIDDQKAELRALARRDNLRVLDILEERQTAKVPGRPVFDAMIRRIEKGEASGIIAWHPDRLARNSVDGGWIIHLIDTGKILDLRFPTFAFEPTPSGKFMLGIMFNQSKYYVDNLSENIKRGIRNKLQNGIKPNRPPLGYLNDRFTKSVVVDQIRAPLIRKMFELYATGDFTIDRLKETVNSLGLTSRVLRRRRSDGSIPETSQPLSRNQYHRLLTNSFYCGIIDHKGEAFEGRHEPIIPRQLFEKVQAVVKRKAKPKTPKLKPFLYRGMFRCGECNCFITTETQKGHNYLRCTKRVKRDCSQRFVREEEIGRQVTEAVASVALPADWADWIIAELQTEWVHSDTDLATATRDLHSRATQIDQQIDRLTDAYLAQALTLDEYKATRTRLIGDKQEFKDRIATLEHNGGNWFEPAIRFVNAAKHAGVLAMTGSDSEKRDFFKKTGSNLRVLNRELRWEPREAWQIVHDQGRFAHKTTAARVARAAVFAGETSHDLHFVLRSGQGEIRTHDSPGGLYRFSRPARLTALPPVRW